MKRIVTQEDLDKNPDLVSLGVQVGDEVNIPDNAIPLPDETPNEGLAGDDPPDPPTGEDRPRKPPIRP